MSSIDKKVVEMEFRNDKFEAGVSKTLSSIDRLKQSLKFDNASKSIVNLQKTGEKFDLSVMENSVRGISGSFSTLEIIGITALSNITNAAINAGRNIFRSLSIDPIMAGFNEYETQMTSVQTILANTSHAGTSLKDVNGALDELNDFADKTIYNFKEMTRNIGTFTAAGIDLDTSVSAIKGIANLAAVSGSTSQQASTAMYQLSQALASGTVKLQDWNSVINAGMGGKVFQDSLVETSRLLKTGADAAIEAKGSFRESLQEGWLTAEVLTETLAKFTGDLSREQLLSKGYTEEQTEAILKLGETALDAATKVKTFSQLMTVLGEAVQTGWADTFRIIFGDFEEAKELFSNIGDFIIGNVINPINDARNTALQGWKDLGGRTKLLEGFKNILHGIGTVIKPIRDAFNEIFPPATGETLYKITEGFASFTEVLRLNENAQNGIKTAFKGLFRVIKTVGGGISAVFSKLSQPVKIFAELVVNTINAILSAFGDFFNFVGDGISKVSNLDIVTKSVEMLSNGMTKLKDASESVLGYFKRLIERLDIFGTISTGLSDVVSFLSKKISGLGDNSNTIRKGINNTGIALGSFNKTSDKAASAITQVGASIGDTTSEFGNIEHAILKTAEANDDFTNSFDNGMIECLKLLGDLLYGIIEEITDFIKILLASIDVFDVVNIGISLAVSGIIASFAFFVFSLSNLMLGMSSVLKGFGKIGNSISGLISSFEKVQKAKALEIKADAFKSIAMSLLLLAIAFKLIYDLNISSENLNPLIGSILTLTFIFMLFTALLNKLSSIKIGIKSGLATTMTMIGFSVACVKLITALSVLSDISLWGIVKSILGLIAVLSVISIGYSVLSKTEINGSVWSKLLLLITFTVGVATLVKALEKLSKLDPNKLTSVLVQISATLAVLVGALYIIKTSGIDKSATKVLKEVAMTVLVLTGVLMLLSLIPAMTVVTSLIKMVGVLAVLIAALWAIKALKIDSISGSFVKLSISIILMAVAFKMLSDISFFNIMKSAFGLALGLLAVGAAGYVIMNVMNGMSLAIPGLLLFAMATIIFAGAIRILGSLDIGSIVASVLALTVVLLAVGVVGSLLSSVSLGFIAIGLGFVTMALGAMVLTAALIFLSLVDFNVIWDGLLRLVLISAALGIVGGIFYFTAPALLLGGAAMLVVAVGLVAMAGAFLVLQLVDLNNIANGLALLCQSIFAITPIIVDLAIISVGFLGLASALLILGVALLVSVYPFVTFAKAAEDLSKNAKPASEDITSLASSLNDLSAKVADIILIGTNLEGFSKTIKKLKEAASDAHKKLDKLYNTLSLYTTLKMSDVEKSGEEFADSFSRGFEEGFESAKQTVNDSFEDLIRLSVKMLERSATEEFVPCGEDFVDKIGDGIDRGQIPLLRTIREMIEDVCEELGPEVESSFKSVGENMIAGMKSGINSGKTGLVTAAASAASEAYTQAKKELDIKSPSKKGIYIGKMFDEGIAVGILSGMKQISDASSYASSLIDGDSQIDIHPRIVPVFDSNNLENIYPEFERTVDIDGALRSVSIDQSLNRINDRLEEIASNQIQMINTIENKTDLILSHMDRMETSMGHMNLYIDGRKLASAMAKPINHELGILSKRGR